MARATYFVNDVNFPDDIVKRPGQVHVQTQHGTPLKHMGLDLMPHPAASKGMVFRKPPRRSDRWDWNLSANRFSTLVWERAFPSPFKTLESGYPAQRRTAARRRRRNRCHPHTARHSRWEDRHPVRADSPGSRQALHHPGGPASPRREPRGRLRPHGPGPLLLPVDARSGPARERGTDPQRLPPARRRDAHAGRGRPRDGLLQHHVRLRQPRPADRRVRTRLGDLPGHPWRLLRHLRDLPGVDAAAPGRRGEGLRVGRGRGPGRERGPGTLPGPVLRVRRRSRRRTGRASDRPRRTHAPGRAARRASPAAPATRPRLRAAGSTAHRVRLPGLAGRPRSSGRWWQPSTR